MSNRGSSIHFLQEVIDNFDNLKIEYTKLYEQKFESKIDKIKDLKEFEEKNRINVYHINKINPQTPNYLESEVEMEVYQDLNPSSLTLMLTTSDFEMSTGVTEKYEFKAESAQDNNDKILVSQKDILECPFHLNNFRLLSIRMSLTR